MLKFDANGDGKLARSEMTEHFTSPLRPELPVEHPGFGIPLPADPQKRKAQQAAFFDSADKNKDGHWTKEEFVASMSSRPGKPMLLAIRPGGQGDVTTLVPQQTAEALTGLDLCPPNNSVSLAPQRLVRFLIGVS